MKQMVAMLAGMLIVAVGGPIGAAPALAEADDLAHLVEQVRYTIVEQEGRLEGDGVGFLSDAVRASHAFLIGEVHLVEEVPQLTRRLLPALHDAGYRTLAIETGPHTARWLVEMLEGQPSAERLAARLEREPFLLPFYDRQAEVELLRDALARGWAIRGLDQEFIGSSRLWLERLSDLATEERASQLVSEWLAREIEAVRHFRETGSTAQAMLSSVTTEELDALQAAFAKSSDASAIISSLRESAAIYRLYGQGLNYESNLRRVRYMKQNLARGLGGAVGEFPRTLYKFGSVHAGRGYSSLHQLDLGNQAAELAFAAGGESFHLWTLPLSRVARSGEISDYRDQITYLQPLLDSMGDAVWTVFDLRPLRPWFHRETHRAENPELAEVVFRYDALAVAPRVHESVLLAPGDDGAGR